jgi:hypothetical protein
MFVGVTLVALFDQSFNGETVAFFALDRQCVLWR